MQNNGQILEKVEEYQSHRVSNPIRKRCFLCTCAMEMSWVGMGAGMLLGGAQGCLLLLQWGQVLGSDPGTRYGSLRTPCYHVL